MFSRKTLYQRTLAFALIASLSGAAHAASYTSWFENETTTNAIYLWLTEASAPATDITRVRFQSSSAMSSWEWTGTTDAIVLFGPTANAGAGRVQLRFDYATIPFSFEYAEVLWSGLNMTLLDSGTLSYDHGSWTASTAFFHAGAMSSPYAAPVPIPNSLLLLLSASCCVALCRRRNQRTESLVS